ncbi:alpha-amylase family glycosyl hydrolase [Bacillaceae bacterium S4-13-58]
MKKKLFVLGFIFTLLIPAISVYGEEGHDWEDERIYFIMVDRFMNGTSDNDFDIDPNDPRAYHGGDLEGIIQKLDYIKGMGFTTIWLTPIMDNMEGGYHGYWIKDFKNVDEHFGTLEDAKRLVDEAHKRDIKVIFDFVVNHTGYNHPWLQDPTKEDWFHPEKKMMGENQEVLETAWLAGLPDLNTENPEVREYLFDSARFWIEETGVDGFRLDTVKHVPRDFWEQFSAFVKNIEEDFFLLGEVWNSDPRYIADYENTGIDTFVDYPLYEAATNSFKKVDQNLSELMSVWNRNKTFYERPYLLGKFLDNHDNPRFTTLALSEQQRPEARWKLALSYFYTTPGIPIIYQGSEVPMEGGNDPDNRQMMDFNSGDGVLEKHLQRLSTIRDQHPALVNGTMEEIEAGDGFLVFKRENDEETLYVAINNSTSEKSAEISDLEEGYQLRGLLNDDLVRMNDDNLYKIGVGPESVEIFKIEEDQGVNLLFVFSIGAVILLFIGFVFVTSRKNKTN